MSHNRLGIAFSGGGLRVLSAIGAVQAFENLNVLPHAVAGCSMGAIIAALWKAGYSGKEMLDIFQSLHFRDTVSWWDLFLGPFSILLHPGRFSTTKMKENLFDRRIPRSGGRENSFDLYLYAFDLSTAQPVFWPNSDLKLDLKEAVLASMALFPDFAPLKVCDSRGREHLLVDGGYYTPIPAEVLKLRAGCDTVIALAWRDARKPDYVHIASHKQVGRRLKQARLLIKEQRGLSYADELIILPSQDRGIRINPRMAGRAYEAGLKATEDWLRNRNVKNN